MCNFVIVSERSVVSATFDRKYRYSGSKVRSDIVEFAPRKYVRDEVIDDNGI